MVLTKFQQPTILYIAVHELNAGWGAETFLASALEELGHQVIRLDYRAHRAELSPLLARAAEAKPDVVFLQRGEGFPCHLLPQFHVPKVYYATEGAWNPDQQAILQEKMFDAYVAASRSTVDFMIRTCGVPATQAQHIPSGYNSNTYHRLEVEQVYNVIAVFNWNLRRRRALWYLLGIQRRRMFSGVLGAECNRLVNQSRIVLNVHRTRTLDTETRLFELLPTAAAIVSEACDTPDLLDGTGIQWFPPGDWRTMRKQVSRLLANEDFRRSCVRQNNEAAPRHTWQTRALAFSRLFHKLLHQS